MIRIESVTKRFGRTTAVDKVSINIPEGDSVALWGANGAGKTTLIRCVLGLVPFHGQIRVGEFDARRDGKRARMLIGYVPQELGFYDDLHVSEAIVFFARLRGLSVGSSGEVLERVGLSGNERKRIRELSGGMKQRLALAMAMLGDPPILVLDEVTASLDACGRHEFVALLSRLSGAGRTMLFASHRVEEVTTLAKRVVSLEAGRVVSEAVTTHFVSVLSPGSLLHLFVKPSARSEAMHALTVGGFSPRLNGSGLLVPVPIDQKAAPFRVLADARISIDDFDFVAGAPSHPPSNRMEGVR